MIFLPRCPEREAVCMRGNKSTFLKAAVYSVLFAVFFCLGLGEFYYSAGDAVVFEKNAVQVYAGGKQDVLFFVKLRSRLEIKSAEIIDAEGKVHAVFSPAVPPVTTSRILFARIAGKDFKSDLFLKIVFSGGMIYNKHLGNVFEKRSKLTCPSGLGCRGRIIFWESVPGAEFYEAEVLGENGKSVYKISPLYARRFLVPPGIFKAKIRITAFESYLSDRATSAELDFLDEDAQAAAQVETNGRYIVFGNNRIFQVMVVSDRRLSEAKINDPFSSKKTERLEWDDRIQCYSAEIRVPGDKIKPLRISGEWATANSRGRIMAQIFTPEKFPSFLAKPEYDVKDDELVGNNLQTAGSGCFEVEIYSIKNSADIFCHRPLTKLAFSDTGRCRLSGTVLYNRKVYCAVETWQDKPGENFSVKVYGSPFYFVHAPFGGQKQINKK